MNYASNTTGFGTKAVHAGVSPDPSTGAIMTPIYQTSTYVQDEPGMHKGYEYARGKNPTRKSLQESIAALENARHAICFSSGMAAVDSVIKLLRPGDEVVATKDLYGGTYRLFTKVFAPLGIQFRFVDMTQASTVETLLSNQTRMLWVETPTNPLLNIMDIAALATLSKKRGLLLCVDNTFATPYLQNPLDLGADIVMHSVTKYLSGHSDVVMGALAMNDKELFEKLHFIMNSTGGVPGPMDSFLVLRGIKTLHLRMQRHCENGKVVAEFLKHHKAVDKVYWPGFETHPNHSIAKAQMRDFGGMISFSLKDDTEASTRRTLKRFELFSLAESLGGVESLVSNPATMTHASIPKADREAAGLKDSLIRLSVGVEDISDLLADLQQALG
jgi:cystathionine beta-lyase/cystathionine gamma-synthase